MFKKFSIIALILFSTSIFAKTIYYHTIFDGEDFACKRVKDTCTLNKNNVVKSECTCEKTKEGKDTKWTCTVECEKKK